MAETKEMETETRLDADRSKRGFDAYRDRDDSRSPVTDKALSTGVENRLGRHDLGSSFVDLVALSI